jgi:hypothetical protein
MGYSFTLWLPLRGKNTQTQRSHTFALISFTLCSVACGKNLHTQNFSQFNYLCRAQMVKNRNKNTKENWAKAEAELQRLISLFSIKTR